MELVGDISSRTVAFLDVLPFKDVLKKFPLIEVGRVYREALLFAGQDHRIDRAFDSASASPVKIGMCISHIFSDSIIIYSINNSQSSCWGVIKYAQRLCQSLLNHQFGVRGAITYGEMFINEAERIHVGQPLVDAVELEKRQEWLVGVMIDKTVESAFPPLFNNTNPEIIPYDVPLKLPAEEFSCNTINWVHGIHESSTEALEHLKTVHGLTDKLQNTLKYEEYVSSIYKSKIKA